MPLEPAITGLEQLSANPALARLLEWDREAVKGARWDRNELTIEVARGRIRDACALLRQDKDLDFNFLADIAGVDRFPAEPRFEVNYHLLSMSRKARVRLKVRLHSDSPEAESLTSLWPAANFFEREIFDLFGVRFTGHPDLRRILMPDDWEGHPLRRDYPVEGFR